jgi:hypothetical protein
METEKKKKYAAPLMETFQLTDMEQLLAGSEEPNTITDLDDYEGGLNPFQF